MYLFLLGYWRVAWESLHSNRNYTVVVPKNVIAFEKKGKEKRLQLPRKGNESNNRKTRTLDHLSPHDPRKTPTKNTPQHHASACLLDMLVRADGARVGAGGGKVVG